MKSRTNTGIFLLIVFAVIVRLWGIDTPGYFRADESMKIPASQNYITTGHVEPDRFFHPPLKYLLYYGSVQVFGDNPYGWRMLTVLFGAATVWLLFLLADELFGVRVAFLAAGLLAADPTHIAQSRTTVDEVLLVAFFLAGFVAAVKYLKGNDNCLMLSGLFVGLSLSIKLYFLPALMVLVFFGLFLKTRERGWSWPVVMDMGVAWILLPLTIYILSYYAWFGRGYGFMDFLQMQIDSYRELQTMKAGDFAMGGVADSKPAVWFVKPLMYGFRYRTDGTWSEYHIDIHNFPIWMLTIPSLVFLAIRVRKYPDRAVAIFMLLFAATYLPFLAIQRPMFVYSSLVILPFTVIAVSFFIVSLMTRVIHGDRYYPFLASAMMLWCLLLYPLAIGKAVPDPIYQPLLSLGKIYNVAR